ncbi:hypothetical protein ACWEKM_15185 [Streptomyces sp. NPDC004752]
MIEAHSPAVLEIRPPRQARPVQARPARHDAFRGERDRAAAVPPHLSLLREALAHDALVHHGGQSPRTHRHGLCASGHLPAHRRRPARLAVARQLTLAQWVSRTTSIR